jgi:hypothetical protein
VQIPAARFVRRDLYVGAARRNAEQESMRLSGIVFSASDGRPLAGAHLSIANGPRTQTNERGEWTLSGAPEGTRTLEVRALGYYPMRIPVHVIAGVPPMPVEMSLVQAVLDTIRVLAASPKARNLREFEERRRSGIGHYITASDIARQHVQVPSELFRMVPGVRLDAISAGNDKRILVRGPLHDWCAPMIFIDGLAKWSLTADELDTWMRPEEIAGIEVYPATGLPAQFEQLSSECGIIVVWTK